MKIAVLVSGGGTNFQALIDKRDSLCGELALCISSNAGAFALERAKNAGIEALVLERGAYADRGAYSQAILSALRERGIGLVILAGFLHILDENFCAAYKDAVINVHPSLIPAFCGEGYFGLRVHRAVLDYGAKLTGASVHFVTAEPDGGPLILQKSVEVLEGDTPERLQARVMEAERELLPRAAALFCAGKLKVEGRQVRILP